MDRKLSDLPPAPAGCADWPWVVPPPEGVERPSVPAAPPKISVVLVSYNQAHYLEQAIRSVLLQGYPNLEFFVIDGGSSDGSVEIIRKYERFLNGWVSEKDRGQSDALNKGFSRCSGVIANWLCSDDLLLPNALGSVAGHFAEHPETDVLAGAAAYRYEDHSRPEEVKRCSAADLAVLPALNQIVQPSCFFRLELCRRPAVIREDLHYMMDCELWCYFLSRKAQWSFTEEVLSVYRVTGSNKAFVGGPKILRELLSIYREYSAEVVPLTFWIRWCWQPLASLGRRRRLPKWVAAAFSRSARGLSVLLGWIYSGPRVQGLQTAFTWYSGAGDGASD